MGIAYIQIDGERQSQPIKMGSMPCERQGWTIVFF